MKDERGAILEEYRWLLVVDGEMTKAADTVNTDEEDTEKESSKTRYVENEAFIIW